MLKKTGLLFLGICLLISISPAHALRLKIATISPDGSFWMKKMREGAGLIKKKTKNRVKIKLYPGGVMGDDRAVLKKIRIGQLHGGALVSGSLSNIYPDVQLYNLPLKFKNFEEIDYVRERTDSLMIEGLKEKGFIVFGLAEGGFAYFMSQKKIHSVGELRSQKLWIPEQDKATMEGVELFKLKPVPLLIGDVRAGLQTGLINTVATSPIGALALQWHTQVKYLTDMPFMYIYAVMALDKKTFDKISPEDQVIVQEILSRIFKEIDQQNRQDNVKALEALGKQNIEFIKPSEENLAEWEKLADGLPPIFKEKGYLSEKMLQHLDKTLKEFRSR